MPLRDVFNKLKTTIVGTNTSDIDLKLDTAVKDITAYRSQIGRNGYIELVKNLISKTGLDVPSSFAQATTLTPAALGQGTRLMRYKTYEGIVYNINYCHRALTVLTDSILAPDDITKTALEVNPTTFLEGEKNVSSDVRNCKELIEKLKLENALDIIVKNTLQFGDFFTEIADAKTALTSRSAILTESYYSDSNKNLESFISEGEDKQKMKVILDYSSFEDDKKKSKEKKIDLADVHLLYYEPKRVVKLQSDMFPVCFGYLIFPQAVLNPSLMIQNQMVNSICQNILSSLSKKIPNLNKDTVNTNDLKDIINTMMRESDPSKTMNIRYVPPSKIQHFMVPSTKFYPYGESIFDPSVFTAKLIIALETALVIYRLNRSTEKRKISVEVGLPRDARKAIEKIKEEFRKRKVSIDTLGTVDTIPSMINTFEDIYLPSKDGKNYVDVTSFGEGMVETRGKVDEIKMLRDTLVSNLGVPASFLGIEENMNAKCIHLDSSIKLLSSKRILLKELINEFNENGEIKNKYTFSYDIETGKIVPGKIVWAGVTRKNARVVKVTLDNGEFEIVTPDHNFMLRDGSFIEAKDLKENDSLMPLYTKITNAMTTLHKTPYVMVYHPGTDTWELAHRVIAKEMGIVTDGDKLNVHHEDFNPMNNNPDNLKGLTDSEHVRVHLENKHFLSTGRGKVKLENYIEEKCIICEDNFIRHIATNQITCLKKECLKERKRLDGLKSWEKRKHNYPPSLELICPYCKIHFIRTDSYIKGSKSGIITCGKKECYKKSFIDLNNTPERKKVLSESGHKGGIISGPILSEYNKIHGSWNKGLTKETDERVRINAENCVGSHLNHKVVSVEFLDYTVDTGDITVEKYNNFSLSSGIIVHNSTLAEENVQYARTIVNNQKYFTHQINDLIKKIYEIVDPEKALTILDNVSIALPPPKSLQFEREAKYLSDLANLVQTLEGIGVPKDWSKKKYLTSIDWDEVKKFEIDEKIEKSLGVDKEVEGGEMGGMGGMGEIPPAGGGGMGTY